MPRNFGNAGLSLPFFNLSKNIKSQAWSFWEILFLNLGTGLEHPSPLCKGAEASSNLPSMTDKTRLNLIKPCTMSQQVTSERHYCSLGLQVRRQDNCTRRTGASEELRSSAGNCMKVLCDTSNSLEGTTWATSPVKQEAPLAATSSLHFYG